MKETFFSFVNAKIENVRTESDFIHVVENYPKKLHLNVEFSKSKISEPGYRLYSRRVGTPGINLIELLIEKRLELLHKIGDNLDLLEGEKDEDSLLISSDVELDLSDYDFSQLRFQFGVLNIKKIRFNLLTHVSQSKFTFNRTEKYHMAAVVENYMREQKDIVFGDKENIVEATDNLLERIKNQDVQDILKNGSIIKVYFGPWASYELTGKEKKGKTKRLVIKL